MRITASERDALFEQLYARLSGIDEVWASAAEQDRESAEGVARKFSDDLRLILDDLGWGESGEAVELSSPPEVLRRVFTRVQTAAQERRREEVEEREETRRREERTRGVARGLPAGAGGARGRPLGQ
jgi:hypothetical protein